MWDIHGIRKWKDEIKKANTRSKATSYQTRPYMMHLDKEMLGQYGIVDMGELEGTKGIDLDEHVGLSKSLVPAFGSPLISYQRSELERCSKII